jgi:hypothetical protein
MFAVLACVLVALHAFGVRPEDVDLFALGIASLALHFAWSIGLPQGRSA